MRFWRWLFRPTVERWYIKVDDDTAETLRDLSHRTGTEIPDVVSRAIAEYAAKP